MASRKTPADGGPRAGAIVPDAADGRKGRFKGIGRASSQIVRDAAALLDDEMAAGVVAARNMQQRLEKERRIDRADFSEALQRFQGDAHEVLTLVSEQLGELKADDNAELLSRFTRNTHDLLDVVVGVVSLTGEIAGQLAAANLPKPPAPSTPTRPKTAAPSTGGATRARG